MNPLGTISFEQARLTVEDHSARLRAGDSEEVELLASAGRVLAELISADRPFPPFRRAARDGYAVRAADLFIIPARLRVVGEIKAGGDSDIAIGNGEAVSIMTGAATPKDADCIVMVEHTKRESDQVEILRGVEAGANVVATGSEAAFGEQLLLPGTLIDHAAISVAASVGKATLKVFRKPRVAILATGDEIVDLNALPGKNQIRNSNTYSLAAQVCDAGGEPVLLPVASDEAGHLHRLICQGLQSDLLVLAGGVSMGKYDLVEQVLSTIDSEFFFTSVAIQPGKPVVFGKCGDRYFFGLPGNPVSTMVTFELFAKPVVQALAGRAAKELTFLRAQLKSRVEIRPGLRRFLPAALSGRWENPEVELAPWQGSGDIGAAARSNCYIVIPPDRSSIPAGEWVPVLMR